MYRLLSLALLFPVLAWAEDARFDGGFDLRSKISEQKYAEGRYKTARLALQPWVSYGDWMAYGELPFEGHEVSFNGTSNSVIIRRGPLGRIIHIPVTQQTGVSQKTDGIADASIGISYALPFIAQPWLADIALDYKFANGDIDNGLGNGSRDLSLSSTLQYTYEKLQLGATIGRTLVDATENTATSTSSIPNTNISNQDYSFWSVSTKFNINPHWAAGLAYSDQSAPYEDAPPQGITSTTIEWRAQSFMKLILGYSRYAHDNRNTQPDSEVSLGANFSF